MTSKNRCEYCIHCVECEEVVEVLGIEKKSGEYLGCELDDNKPIKYLDANQCTTYKVYKIMTDVLPGEVK